MHRSHLSLPLVGAVILGLGVLVAPTATLTADAVVPPSVQAALTVRILEYDRALPTWNGGAATLLVGVVSRERSAAEDYRRGLEGQRAQGVPLSAAEHVYRDAASFGRWLEHERVGVVYLAADLGGDAAAAVAAATAHNVRSIVATREHFRAGATLAIVIRDDRPHILVHLARSRSVGMDLHPKLLELAEVVR